MSWVTWAAALTLWVLSAQAAAAVDARFTLVLAVPATESTRLVVSYDGLFPVLITEILPGATTADLSLLGMEPGPYRLHVAEKSPPEVRDLEFTLISDGTILFESSAAIEQSGNRVVLME